MEVKTVPTRLRSLLSDLPASELAGYLQIVPPCGRPNFITDSRGPGYSARLSLGEKGGDPASFRQNKFLLDRVRWRLAASREELQG